MILPSHYLTIDKIILIRTVMHIKYSIDIDFDIGVDVHSNTTITDCKRIAEILTDKEINNYGLSGITQLYDTMTKFKDIANRIVLGIYEIPKPVAGIPPRIKIYRGL